MSANECPERQYHGNPFRYCSCGWAEPALVDEGAKRTDDIENRFTYHPPKDAAAVQAHEAVRAALKTTAHFVAGAIPAGREAALALTKLEEAMFWANAAIAREVAP